MDKKEALYEGLARTIVGDIVFSSDPSAAIGKWRNIFGIRQSIIAENMGVMPSVVSDYESGRRKSPGSEMVKKFVSALFAADRMRANCVSKDFIDSDSSAALSDVIIDSRQLENPVTLESIIPVVKGEYISDGAESDRKIRGYTIFDSVNAVIKMSQSDVVRLNNLAAERAIVLTEVEHGKSSIIALKLMNIKPGVVIFHGLKGLDKLAERIARVEKIPVIISGFSTMDELIAALKSLGPSRGSIESRQNSSSRREVYV
jgi:putative transcriptional regulator